MKKLKSVSATSLTTYTKCPRKAVIEALGLRTFSTTAQKRGTDLHAALEAYLVGKTPDIEDDLGIYARLNGFLPSPGEDILVEVGIGEHVRNVERYANTERWTGHEVTCGNVPFKGIIDLVRFDRGILEVWDHKTTSSWYYAETSESLRRNVQLWAYAYAVAVAYDYDGPIECGHIQYRKTKVPTSDDVRLTSFRTARGEVNRKWSAIESLSRAFEHDVNEAARLLDIASETRECGAYGGCPNRAFCDALGHNGALPSAIEAWRKEQ